MYSIFLRVFFLLFFHTCSWSSVGEAEDAWCWQLIERCPLLFAARWKEGASCRRIRCLAFFCASGEEPNTRTVGGGPYQELGQRERDGLMDGFISSSFESLRGGLAFGRRRYVVRIQPRWRWSLDDPRALTFISVKIRYRVLAA